MSDVFHRPAEESDLPQLLLLYEQLDSGTSALSLDRLQTIFIRMQQYPDYHIYLAFDGAQLLGSFALLIADTVGSRCAPIGIVEDVVVDESARGQGIGLAMMSLAMDKCRQAGCYKMMLSSNLSRTDAHRFYESLGFEKHGYSFQVMLQKEPDPGAVEIRRMSS